MQSRAEPLYRAALATQALDEFAERERASSLAALCAHWASLKRAKRFSKPNWSGTYCREALPPYMMRLALSLPSPTWRKVALTRQPDSCSIPWVRIFHGIAGRSPRTLRDGHAKPGSCRVTLSASLPSPPHSGSAQARVRRMPYPSKRDGRGIVQAYQACTAHRLLSGKK
jgi:hypothetical protein